MFGYKPICNLITPKMTKHFELHVEKENGLLRSGNICLARNKVYISMHQIFACNQIELIYFLLIDLLQIIEMMQAISLMQVNDCKI